MSQPNKAQVTITGRNVEVPDHFRIYVSEKLFRMERFDPSIYLFDVELFHERNRRHFQCADEGLAVVAYLRGVVDFERMRPAGSSAAMPESPSANSTIICVNATNRSVSPRPASG